MRLLRPYCLSVGEEAGRFQLSISCYSQKRMQDRLAEMKNPIIGLLNPCEPSSSPPIITDRKSTRLNSSHTVISYAVFCLKKKKKIKKTSDHKIIKQVRRGTEYPTLSHKQT